MQIASRKALKIDTNSNGPRPRIEVKLQRTKNVEKQAKTSFGSI